MFGAELSIDEEVDEVVLGRFLQSLDGETLETDIVLVVALDEISDQFGERELADQKLRALLVLLDFAAGHGTLLRAAGFHDALGGAGRLTDCLTCDGLARRLRSGHGFASSVLSTSHFLVKWNG